VFVLAFALVFAGVVADELIFGELDATAAGLVVVVIAVGCGELLLGVVAYSAFEGGSVLL